MRTTIALIMIISCFSTSVMARQVVANKSQQHRKVPSIIPVFRSPESNPIFSVAGVDTENPFNLSLLAGFTCRIVGDIAECNRNDLQFDEIGVNIYKLSFNNAKLYSFVLFFDSVNYAPLLKTLVVRYGQPSTTQTIKWYDRSNNLFESPKASWGFKSGVMTLTRRENSSPNGTLIFTSGANYPKLPR